MYIDYQTMEQSGGLAANAIFKRHFTPTLSQAKFTGLALLDPQAKRIRPKQAMDYWSNAHKQYTPPPVAPRPETSEMLGQVMQGATVTTFKVN